VHYGITMSMYYADPDGNQIEQVDAFASSNDANRYMLGPHFEANPIGVEDDPAWPGRQCSKLNICNHTKRI
jgi:hypothetical protein